MAIIIRFRMWPRIKKKDYKIILIFSQEQLTIFSVLSFPYKVPKLLQMKISVLVGNKTHNKVKFHFFL